MKVFCFRSEGRCFGEGLLHQEGYSIVKVCCEKRVLL